jgi:hypothetical protein
MKKKPSKSSKQPHVAASDLIRRLTIENPTASDADIAALAEKAGQPVCMPTLRGYTQAVRGVLKTLDDLGLRVTKAKR